MNEMDFSFEESPWEEYVDSLKPGDRASAAALLSLMEGEDETVFEDVLLQLEADAVFVDIKDLPKGYGSGEGAARLRQEEQLVKKGLRYQELEATDPLRLYLEELAMTPAAGDEDVLIRQAANGDEAAKLMLTNLGLSRVVEAAKLYVGRGVLLLDLIQEGSLGLWHAIHNWQGGVFRVESDWWIQSYMSRAVVLQARSSGVGQKLRAALEDYRNVDEQLLSDLGRNPTVEEIAEAMHISAEAAAAIGQMVENARRLQQAKKQPEPEEEKEAEEQAVEDTAYFQARQRVNEMLSDLTETEAKLISLRFGLEGGLPLSPQETGRKLGLTPDEVVAMEAKAMAKMRKQ